MARWIIGFGVFVLVASATICQPALLGENKFLDSFVSNQLVSILVIVLTVTMASVANVMMTLGRYIKRLHDAASAKGVAIDLSPQVAEIERELKGNAWLLFWVFCVALGFLFLKGAYPGNVYVASSANGAAIVVMTLYLLALHDLYSTIYALVKADGQAMAPATSVDGSEPLNH